jgi:hypothetical protein
LIESGGGDGGWGVTGCGGMLRHDGGVHVQTTMLFRSIDKNSLGLSGGQAVNAFWHLRGTHVWTSASLCVGCGGDVGRELRH